MNIQHARNPCPPNPQPRGLSVQGSTAQHRAQYHNYSMKWRRLGCRRGDLRRSTIDTPLPTHTHQVHGWSASPPPCFSLFFCSFSLFFFCFYFFFFFLLLLNFLFFVAALITNMESVQNGSQVARLINGWKGCIFLLQ